MAGLSFNFPVGELAIPSSIMSPGINDKEITGGKENDDRLNNLITSLHFLNKKVARNYRDITNSKKDKEVHEILNRLDINESDLKSYKYLASQFAVQASPKIIEKCWNLVNDIDSNMKIVVKECIARLTATKDK